MELRPKEELEIEQLVKILEPMKSVTIALAYKKLRRTSDIECEFPQTDDFAGNVLAKKKKDTKQMKYIPCSFILPTSNHLERFFSAAGFASNDYRKSTLPMNLEEQLFLRFNKKHWDLNLVNQIVSASE